MPPLTKTKYHNVWWDEHYRTSKYGVESKVRRHEKSLQIRDSPKPPDFKDRKYTATVHRYDKSTYGKDQQIRGTITEVERANLTSHKFEDAVDEAVRKLGPKVVEQARTKDPKKSSFELEIEQNKGHGPRTFEQSVDLSVEDIINYRGNNWFEIEDPEDKSYDPKIYGSIKDRRFVYVDKKGRRKEVLTYVINPKALDRKQKSGRKLTDLERHMLAEYKDDEKYRPSGADKRKKRSGRGRGNEKKRFRESHPFIYVIFTKIGGKKETYFTHNATKDDAKNSSYDKKNFKDRLQTTLAADDLKDLPASPHPPPQAQAAIARASGGRIRYQSNLNREKRIWSYKAGNLPQSYVEPSLDRERIKKIPLELQYTHDRSTRKVERPPLPPDTRDFSNYGPNIRKFHPTLNAWKQKNPNVTDTDIDDYYMTIQDVDTKENWETAKAD